VTCEEEHKQIIAWLRDLADKQWNLGTETKWPTFRTRHNSMAQAFEAAANGIEREDYKLFEPEEGK
tara:strand:+ start:1161 stop:1358 length:198 start_codon:yes stop_codon:yes gene_type:complete